MYIFRKHRVSHVVLIILEAYTLLDNSEFLIRLIQSCLLLKLIYDQKIKPQCKEPIPKIENKYSQKRNCVATVPVSTFMCLWAIYIFPRLICLFGCRKYVDRSSEYINRSQTHECGNESTQFPEKEYINGIRVAVHATCFFFLGSGDS
jgi:hypothetical protein